MADLTRLPHRLDLRSTTCRAVIETPKGMRSKYDYDPASGAFEIGGLLPEGMSFPLDFGFIPSTLGEDGDPLDVMVLFDEPCVVGALLEVRLLGVIEGQQTEEGRSFRNDRLLATATQSRQFASLRKPEDLGRDYLDQLERFWVQYNALKGKRFAVLALRGPAAAVEAVRRTPQPGAPS
jgi:inorganic pyrophosphatase